jgi:hypothetical protein
MQAWPTARNMRLRNKSLYGKTLPSTKCTNGPPRFVSITRELSIIFVVYLFYFQAGFVLAYNRFKISTAKMASSQLQN